MFDSSRLFFQDETPRPLGRLTRAGTLFLSQGIGRSKLRTLGSYAVVLQVGGSGFFRDVQGRKCQVAAGDCLLIFPEIAHAYGPRTGTLWNEIFVCFDGPIFDVWRHEGLLAPTRPVHQVPNWPELAERLWFLLDRPRPLDLSEHLSQIHDFLAILAEMVALPATQNEGASWLERAQALLSANLSDILPPERVAHAVGMSYESFRKRFAAEVGVSPSRFRDLARLKAAQTLILEGALKNQAIAHSLGFRDEAHLARRFRELTGQSPREWKQATKAKAANE